MTSFSQSSDCPWLCRINNIEPHSTPKLLVCSTELGKRGWKATKCNKTICRQQKRNPSQDIQIPTIQEEPFFFNVCPQDRNSKHVRSSLHLRRNRNSRPEIIEILRICERNFSGYDSHVPIIGHQTINNLANLTGLSHCWPHRIKITQQKPTTSRTWKCQVSRSARLPLMFGRPYGSSITSWTNITIGRLGIAQWNGLWTWESNGRNTAAAEIWDYFVVGYKLNQYM